MSRFRLQPTPAQERVLLEHCGHARFVWNLAVEQHAHWKPGRKTAPGFGEQCRQLTEARAANLWLAAGSVIVQQQALKDFAQAMANFFGRKSFWRATDPIATPVPNADNTELDDPRQDSTTVLGHSDYWTDPIQQTWISGRIVS